MYICIYMNKYESVIDEYYDYIRFTIMVTQKVLTLDMKRDTGKVIWDKEKVNTRNQNKNQWDEFCLLQDWGQQDRQRTRLVTALHSEN